MPPSGSGVVDGATVAAEVETLEETDASVVGVDCSVVEDFSVEEIESTVEETDFSVEELDSIVDETDGAWVESEVETAPPPTELTETASSPTVTGFCVVGLSVLTMPSLGQQNFGRPPDSRSHILLQIEITYLYSQ